MNLIKSILLKVLVKKTAKANMLSTPKTIKLPDKKLIGYSITTTIKNNKQKEDIPPFYHDIYDNNKLGILKSDDEFNMYCIFDMHLNQEDFDYYITVENKTGIDDDEYAQIQIPEGKYIQVELIKRNNKTVSMIIFYIRNIWLKSNGYKERKAPLIILYDQRFHTNYQKYGCRGNDYLGMPVATLQIPVED